MTDSSRVNLLTCTPVPDLAVLLFSTDLVAALPPPPPAAAAPVASGTATQQQDEDKEDQQQPQQQQQDEDQEEEEQQSEQAASSADSAAAAEPQSLDELCNFTAEDVHQALGLPQEGEGPQSGNSASSSSSSGSAQLLSGFAGYSFEQPDDLAALMWLREHMQLLLELAVSVWWFFCRRCLGWLVCGCVSGFVQRRLKQ